MKRISRSQVKDNQLIYVINKRDRIKWLGYAIKREDDEISIRVVEQLEYKEEYPNDIGTTYSLIKRDIIYSLTKDEAMVYYKDLKEGMKIYVINKDDGIRWIGIITKVDILAFEFEMGLFPNIMDQARERGIDLALKYIPPEVFDKRAIEKNQVVFHDVCYIEIKPLIKKDSIAIKLTDFSVFYNQESVAQVESILKNGSKKLVVENGQIIKISKDKNGEPIEHIGVLEAVGIDREKRNITCHTFRRTINDLRKDMGCPLEDRKILLGHKVRDVNVRSYTNSDYREYLLYTRRACNTYTHCRE